MKYVYGKRMKTFKERLVTGFTALALLASNTGMALPMLLTQRAHAATVSTQAELEAAIAGSDAVIDITAGFTVTSRINITRSVTINGNGHTLLPNFTGPGAGNSNNASIGIASQSDITINNLVIDGTNGTQLHGINVFASTNVILNNITSINNNRSGIVVNGSAVTVNNVTTAGNGWHGINVDKGSAPSAGVLTVTGVSSHGDLAHIYIDNTANGSVVDTNSQYTSAHINLGGTHPNDLLYTLIPIPACDSGDTTFDTFGLGSVNGQGGWESSGPYDQEIVDNTYGFASFGCKSLRISNAVTSGAFGNQTFSYSVPNEAGDAEAVNGGKSGGVRQNRFEAQFDIASTQASHQPGLIISVSPDRGDGARMSFLRFEDQADGIHVVFADVLTTTDPASWNYTDVATLSRTEPHSIRFLVDFYDGPSNDVVKIYVNGSLVHTGTTWENYFRFDDESNPTLADESRTVDSLLFQARGTAAPATQDEGFLFDNVLINTSNRSDEGPQPDCKETKWWQWTKWGLKKQKVVTCVEPPTCQSVKVTSEHKKIAKIKVKRQGVSGWQEINNVNKYHKSIAQTDPVEHPIVKIKIQPKDSNKWIEHSVSAPEDCGRTLAACSVSVFSDTTNKVVEKGNADAKQLSWTHPAWTANIPGAVWIWGDDPVVDPANETVQTFKKTFGWSGAVLSAVIDIAADNDYELKVNGGSVIATGTNTFSGAQQHDIASYIVEGNNTIEIKVTNWEWNTNDPQVNPAGLLYKAVITTENETGEGCNPPVVPEPQTPKATIVAHKIICDEESDLPNDGFASIGAATHTDWLNGAGANKGCVLAENWSFEYSTAGDQGNPGDNLYGPKGNPWQTFTATGVTASVEIPIENVSLIQTREVLKDGYIPFAGQHAPANSYSAEFYCSNDAANFDNWEWIQNPQNGATYHCVAWNVLKPAKIHATKIVCDNEASLPDYGAGGPNINADTASDFLSNSQGCHEEPWQFQWSKDGVGNPGNNLAEGGAGWNTFSGTETINLGTLGDNWRVWVREVWDDDYIPFTGQNTDQNVSAEIACDVDVLNYDNWEWIDLQPGQEYHCVAWNVLKPAEFKVHAAKVICDAEEYLPNWGAGADDITSATAQTHVDESEGHCQLADWEFEWSVDGVGNPGDNKVNGGAGWTPFTGTATIPLSESGSKIWVREVTNPTYIGFTGQNTTQDVSAEIYCNNDVLNYDNWEWIDNLQANANYYCVAFNVLKPVTLSAVKIECTSEIFLPNWGGGSHGPITAATADEFLADVNEGTTEGQENCYKVEWDFQWGTPANGDPEDNAGALPGWNSFVNGTAHVWPADLAQSNDLRVREVWRDSYIPFTGQNTTEDISAEIYCNDDVLHYDNWEWIDNVQSGDTYYCVAWNVPLINGELRGFLFNDENRDGEKDPSESFLIGQKVYLLTHNSPWTLRAITTTNGVGQYAFEDLSVPGNYWVCQEIQPDWFQTLLNNAGLGGINIGSAAVGDVIGDSPELDALIAEFCYEANLSTVNQSITTLNFGSTPNEQGFTEGAFTDTPSGDPQVLADTDLAGTGSLVIPFAIVSAAILGAALWVTRRQRQS